MHRLLFILITVLLVACSSGSPGTPSVDASQNEVITTPMSEFFRVNGSRLSISTGALDRDFLMEAAVQSQTDALRFAYGLSGQVVFFQKRGDKLVMMRSDAGQTTDSSFPTEFVLAKFEITKSDAQWLEFNFDQGMALVLDGESPIRTVNEPNQALAAIPIQNAITNEMHVNTAKLVIDQSVQVLRYVDKGEGLLDVEGYRVHYSISPYQKNPNYKKVISPKEGKVGFFATDQLLLPVFGTPVRYVQRWDISRPIQYYYSKNTPQEFIQAIKDGVLYWNKAFGREVVRIKEASTDDTLPSADNNLIQWHNNDNNGLGVGSSQHDPLTGERRRSLLYISSGWTRHRHPSDFRQDAQQKGQSARVGIFGFSGSNDCKYGFHEGRELFAGFEVTSERALMVAQDVLRSVMAHEVGHTLGLRHNFAGSAASRWSAEETVSHYKEYLRDGSPSTIRPVSSTVMDYATSEQDALIGYWIRTDGEALDYDRQIIHWGYHADGFADAYPTEVYCTDQWVGQFNDCSKRSWDGPNALADSAFMLSYSIQRIPINIAETLLAYRAELSHSGNAKTWLDALPSAEDFAFQATEPLSSLRSWLDDTSQSVSVLSRGTDMTEWLDKKIGDAGGFKKLFSGLFNLDFDQLSKQFKTDLNDYMTSATFGWTSNGKVENLTVEEVAVFKNEADKILKDIPEELAKAISYRLSTSMKKVAPYRKFKKFKDLETVLARWAEFVILSETKSGEFRFNIQTRRYAAATLSPDMGPVIDWEEFARNKIANGIIDHWEKVLGKPLKEVQDRELPREQRQKFLEDMQLAKSL